LKKLINEKLAVVTQHRHLGFPAAMLNHNVAVNRSELAWSGVALDFTV